MSRMAEHRERLKETLEPLKQTSQALYSSALSAVYSSLELRGPTSAMEHAKSIVERHEDVQLTQRISRVA